PSALRQPEMVPFSLTNTKLSPLKAPLAAPGLKLVPVLPPVGMVTTRGSTVVALLAGATWYSVATPVLLSETQNGLAGEAVMPQGLIRLPFGTWAGWIAWLSLTRSTTSNSAARAGAVRPRARRLVSASAQT